MSGSYAPHGGSSPSSSTESRRQANSTATDVPSAVQSLLLATKRLQSVLHQWSLSAASENEVSDVYVQLGNEFNAMVSAFARYNVDMSDVYSVPRDLRRILEQCLGEDASPQVLHTYMPDVRQILYNLFDGLKSKQAEYWRAVGGRRS